MTTITRYAIPSTVIDVKEHWETVGGHKDGDQTIITTENRGWFILLEGSRERLFIGFEKPELNKGDKVRIIIEKIND